jgi:uncharacterized protein
MKFSLDNNPTGYSIRYYKTGEITLHNGTIITQSFIITPNALITDWLPQSLAELNASHMEQFIELHPAVVILGVGPSLQFPASEVLMPLLNANIGVDVMDTTAACRTFNLLAAEGRNVAAGLLLA